MKSVALSSYAVLPRITAVGYAIIVVSLFMYGFFLLETVMHASSRASLSEAVSDAKVAIADAQTAYFAAASNLTPTRATELGLVTPTKVYAVDVSAPSLAYVAR